MNSAYSDESIIKAFDNDGVFYKEDFTGLHVEGLKLKRGYYDACNFTGTALPAIRAIGIQANKCTFEDCSLQHADFSRTNLVKTDFKHANLYDARFNFSYLSKCNFTRANLEGGNFSLAYINHCNFDNAHLRRTCFTSTTLRAVSFCGADISLVNFDDANIIGIETSGAKLNPNCNILMSAVILEKLANTDVTSISVDMKYEITGIAAVVRRYGLHLLGTPRLLCGSFSAESVDWVVNALNDIIT